MDRHFFIGVDGGATKCIVRVEDQQGHLLGRHISGSANIRLSTQAAWEAIHLALQPTLATLGVHLGQAGCHFHIGMGIAGCESKAAYNVFMSQASPHFETVLAISDAYTACIGAHQGQDGALIIAGTGSVGLQIEQDQVVKVGGYGFPTDDGGSGAWIGLQATSLTLKYLDQRLDKDELLSARSFAESIYSFFAADPQHFIEWTQSANSTAFATLVPVVTHLAEVGNDIAITILKKAAQEITLIADALYRKQTQQHTPLPCTLAGGVGTYLQPFLSDTLRARLVSAKAPAEVGAIYWLRSHLQKKDL